MTTTDHVILRFQNGVMSLFCDHCGGSEPMLTGVRIEIVTFQSSSFTEIHKFCKPARTPDKEPETITEWLRSPYCGTSSLTIVQVLVDDSERALLSSIWHYTLKGLPPVDPGDFERCHRVLKLRPDWIPRLHEVSDRYPEWKRLVECWPELTALFEEEMPSGKAPKLYKKMQELR